MRKESNLLICKHKPNIIYYDLMNNAFRNSSWITETQCKRCGCSLDIIDSRYAINRVLCILLAAISSIMAVFVYTFEMIGISKIVQLSIVLFACLYISIISPLFIIRFCIRSTDCGKHEQETFKTPSAALTAPTLKGRRSAMSAKALFISDISHVRGKSK